MQKLGIHYSVDDESYATDFLTVNLIKFNDYTFSQVNVGTDGSGTLVINDDKEVLLVHSIRPVVGEISWEIPRGGIDPGETPRQAASRELYEEASFSVPEDKLLSLGYINPDNGILNTRLHLFLHKTSQKPTHVEGDGFEVAAVKWFPLGSVINAIYQNIITDSITIAAFGKAKLANII
jgi:8-oxo-dGTP pyrophosphatase MutT (NUDIX family)